MTALNLSLWSQVSITEDFLFEILPLIWDFILPLNWDYYFLDISPSFSNWHMVTKHWLREQIPCTSEECYIRHYDELIGSEGCRDLNLFNNTQLFWLIDLQIYKVDLIWFCKFILQLCVSISKLFVLKNIKINSKIIWLTLPGDLPENHLSNKLLVLQRVLTEPPIPKLLGYLFLICSVNIYLRCLSSGNTMWVKTNELPSLVCVTYSRLGLYLVLVCRPPFCIKPDYKSFHCYFLKYMFCLSSSPRSSLMFSYNSGPHNYSIGRAPDKHRVLWKDMVYLAYKLGRFFLIS